MPISRSFDASVAVVLIEAALPGKVGVGVVGVRPKQFPDDLVVGELLVLGRRDNLFAVIPHGLEDHRTDLQCLFRVPQPGYRVASPPFKMGRTRDRPSCR